MEFFNASNKTTVTPVNVESEPTVCDTDNTVKKTRDVHFPFKGRSKFVPPSKRNSSIDTYCRLVNSDIDRIYKKRKYTTYHNLSKAEHDALRKLQNDKTIIIKSADKGGALVVQNTSDYRAEIERQLSNENYYRKLKGDPTRTFKDEIKQFLEVALSNGVISKKNFDFLYTKSPMIPVLYTLPKINKSIECPPGRPVVAGINFVTAPLSIFADHHIKSFVFELPTFVKDTNDVLQSLRSIDNVPESTILCTLDVESLYTNIPHQGGLEALNFFLNGEAETDTQFNTLT